MQLREHQQQLEAFYKTQAGKGFWTDKYKPYLSLYRDRLFKRNEAIAAAVPARLERVLDIGCGRGDILELFAPRAKIAVGTDLAEVMVQAARENLRGRDNVVLLCSPAEWLPFRNDLFDAIILADVVEHLVDAPRCLRECRRILKPGGRMVITTPHARVEHFWQRVDRGLSAPFRVFSRRRKRRPAPRVLERFLSPRELLAFAHRSGLAVREHRFIEFYPGSEGGGIFGRVLRLIARESHLRRWLVEPVFRSIFAGVELLRIFNNRQLLVLEKGR